MPPLTPEGGAAIGQVIGLGAGALLRSIVDGGELDKQAELAAQMFEETGHPTGAQLAEVLRDDPQAGMMFLRQLGGAGPAYDRLTRMQGQAQAGRALEAQNEAVLSQARIPLEMDPNDRSSAIVDSYGTTQPPPDVNDPRVRGQLVDASRIPVAFPPGDAMAPQPEAPRDSLVTDLEAVARQGGDVSSTLDALRKLQKLREPRVTNAKPIMQEYGIDPDNYTGASLKAFMEHVTAGKSPADAYTLLRRRETGDGQKPPAGYHFVEKPDGGVELVPFAGTTAEISAIKAGILRKRMRGEKISEAEWATWDMLVNSNPINALLRGSLGNASGGELEALGGARGRATQADRDEATEELRGMSGGSTPTREQIDTYLRNRGFEVQ